MTNGAGYLPGWCTALAIGLGAANAPAAEPIVLENGHLAVKFDAGSGAWTHLIDKATGVNLISAPALPVPTDLIPWLDEKQIATAITAGQASSIEGHWGYIPEPAKTDAAILAAPGFDDSKWDPTPVPSREDTGDRRLKDRVGAFWYRTKVKIPAAWQGRDLALIIGAVDDYDTTYFNGREIGAVGEGVPRHWEIPRHYVIAAEAVRFGEANTVAIRVVNAAFSGGIAGPVCVGLADALPSTQPTAKLESVERPADGLLHLQFQVGPVKIRCGYFLERDKPVLCRGFIFTAADGRTEVIRGAACKLPDLNPGTNAAVCFPDALPVGDQPLAALKVGQTLRPSSQDGLTFLWSPDARLGIGAWFLSQSEYAPVSVARHEHGASITHNVGVQGRIGKLSADFQYLWLVHGPRDAVLRSAQDIFGLNGPPRGGLPNLREKIIYCGHPGGMPEQNYIGYGGFKALQAYVPTLQKMGVDLLWLLPIFEHGDGKRWNLYSPFDAFQISPLYGTPQELKALSAAARGAGIRLMFDLVPHGPPEHTELAKAHPDWVCLDEAGKPIHAWGQLAFDNANAGWQEYMRKAAEHHAREYGIVGARVDVASGSPVNWDPKVKYRPSFSTLGGGLGMDRAIRSGLLAVQPGVVLLPEEYTGCRIFYRDADLTYDAQLFFLMVELQERKASPEKWAASLQQFLHDQSLTLPKGAIKMRWTANHDTVSWTFQKKRTRDVYGLPRARALLALCCLIDGVPMIYQGEEDPTLYGGKGPSLVDDIAKIIACRKRLPAVSRGTADYAAVQATGGVFACLRTEGGDRAIVLVSLNPDPVQTRLILPAELASAARWRDELSGERHPPTAIPMTDHQVRVLVPVK